MNNLTDKVKSKTIHSKEKSDNFGEVFTPIHLIEQMLDALPKDFWLDETKTWFDPSAGSGQMPAVIVTRLMETLKPKIGDDRCRYAWIMERQIYMAEIQRESAETINEIFNPNGDVKLNLFVGDVLKMPEDFFDLSYEERFKKYPENCIEPTPRNVTDSEIKVTDKKDPWMESILKLAKTIQKPTEDKKITSKTDKYLAIARKLGK